MPSKLRSDRPKPIDTNPARTRQLPPTQHFRDTLVELSAALAILSEVQPQQIWPSGKKDEAVSEQFEPPSQIEPNDKFGVPLSDLLWSFALIFSPSRCGIHVVASVLREQPQADDETKSLFTVYLTSNESSWKDADTTYQQMWQYGVDRTKSLPGPTNILWQRLTKNCTDRIQGYADTAQRSMLGKKEEYEGSSFLKSECESTHTDFDTWAHHQNAPRFAIALNELLGTIRSELKSELNPDRLPELTKKVWHFQKQHGDQFEELFGCLEERTAKAVDGDVIVKLQGIEHNLKLKYPSRARLFLKCIENLAKVPRAFFLYLRFRAILESTGAKLKIVLLSAKKLHVPVSANQNAGLVKRAIDMLARQQNSRISTTDLEKIKKKVDDQKDCYLHCEIQLLQHFFSLSEREGMWNVLGCSKRPCFACSRLLQASPFAPGQSHGKAYNQNLAFGEKWFEGQEGMPQALQNLKDEAVESVLNRGTRETNTVRTRKRFDEPDSPTRQDWGSELLNGLKDFELLRVKESQPRLKTRGRD
ncbi:hypothetical protein F4678DRAFT_478186 [Xylaria arbuscula]|nr:hypothetical protein F4678DRAFT_478186 [Xylaria arbuscula]